MYDVLKCTQQVLVIDNAVWNPCSHSHSIFFCTLPEIKRFNNFPIALAWYLFHLSSLIYANTCLFANIFFTCSCLNADAKKSLKLIAISTTSVNKLCFPFHGGPIISGPDPFLLLNVKGSWFISNSCAIFLSFSTLNFLIIFFTLLTSFLRLSAPLYLIFFMLNIFSFLGFDYFLGSPLSPHLLFILTKTIFISRWYAWSLRII